MNMEMAEVVMNPVRQRIFQYFLLHQTGTAKELKKHCPMFQTQACTATLKFLRLILSLWSWGKTEFAARLKAFTS